MSTRPRNWPGRPPAGQAPCTRPIAESLHGAGPLAQLLERVRASQARLDSLRSIVPADLHAHLQSGPLDDEGWTLLAPNPAVAAKLRQWLPTIAEHLQARGWPATPVRLKIQGGAGAR